MDGWGFKKWLVAQADFESEHFHTREKAEKHALGLADQTPGYRVAVYQCVSLVEAKVSKAKVRDWPRERVTGG